MTIAASGLAKLAFTMWHALHYWPYADLSAAMFAVSAALAVRGGLALSVHGMPVGAGVGFAPLLLWYVRLLNH